MIGRKRLLLSDGLCIASFALTVSLGCDPQSNADLQTFLTPAPTPVLSESPYTLSGTVTESGSGQPLANVLVQTTGRTAMTNENGFYEFRGLGRTELSFNKDGFERPGPFFVGMARPTSLDTSMQRAIRPPVTPFSSVLFRDDPYFSLISNQFDDWNCGPPCKLIRVTVPTNGRLRARIAWQAIDRELFLFITQGVSSNASAIVWAHGSAGTLNVEQSVASGGDAFLYFGLVDPGEDSQDRPELPANLPFTLTTSIAP